MKNKKILVTGASGLLGSHLTIDLLKEEYDVRAVVHERNIEIPPSKNLELVYGDLTDPRFCDSICKGIDRVFHLAVQTGSIAKNADHPASIMTSTVLMDFNMLKAAHQNSVSKYLYCSCACVYPADLADMEESLAWAGPPPQAHETISWSKRISELQCLSFHREYGDKVTIVRPSNTYGPYDVFDVENSHVISAFVKKAADRADPFIIWGNGEQVREFVFAADVAKGMIAAVDADIIADPINLAGGTAITIKKLAAMIIGLTGYSPEITFDPSKPSGHSRRVLSANKARKMLGFLPSTPLEQGLKETISWHNSRFPDTHREQ